MSSRLPILEGAILNISQQLYNIHSANVSPSIIVYNTPAQELNTYVSGYSLEPSLVDILYNGIQNETITVDGDNLPVEKIYIITCLMKSQNDIERGVQVYMEVSAEPRHKDIANVRQQLTDLFFKNRDQPFMIIEKNPTSVHQEIDSDYFILKNLLFNAYNMLKGRNNSMKLPLQHEAIIGGIAYAYVLANKIKTSSVKLETLYPLADIMKRYEPEDSNLYITANSLLSAYQWYQRAVKHMYKFPMFFYDALQSLVSRDISTAPELQNFVMLGIMPDSERISIRPVNIDLIDLISNITTSKDVPLVAVNTNSRTIFKVNEDSMKEPVWYTSLDPETARIVLRISKFPVKYTILEYESSSNQFYVLRRDKYMKVPAMLGLLAKHMKNNILTPPTVSTYSYTFMSNYIGSDVVGESIGLDRSILAWVITNPPEPYKTRYSIVEDEYGNRVRKYEGPCLDTYVFIKEDNKPDALKEHYSVHIKIGTYKMYLSIATKGKTSSGTVSKELDIMEDDEIISGDIVAFESEQRFFRVKINRCPSIEYAIICQEIYKYIIYLYMKYYQPIRHYLSNKYGIMRDDLKPRILPLQISAPQLKNRYGFYASDLYKLSRADPGLYPIPIDKDEMHLIPKWLADGYTIAKLPMEIINDPTITFDISDEIWFRTPSPGYFSLIPKKDKKNSYYAGQSSREMTYLPIYSSVLNNLIIYNSNDPDSSLHWKGRLRLVPDYNTEYILSKPKENQTLDIGRLCRISGLISLMGKIIPREGDIFLEAFGMFVPRDVLFTMNNMYLGGAQSLIKTEKDIARNAYICKQECYDQTVEQIAEDILQGQISYLKHWRALEETYNVNIYFFNYDSAEFYRPPHKYFYVHRRAVIDRPTLIFAIHESLFMLIAYLDTRKYKGGMPKGYYPRQYYLPSKLGKQMVPDILDNIVNEQNTVNMLYPIDGTIASLIVENIPTINRWKPEQQYVDSNGKCRGIVYMSGKAQATVNVGFKPIQRNLPLTLGIVPPTMSMDSFTRKFIPTISSLHPGIKILLPYSENLFSKWKIQEKQSRYLCLISHVIYSLSDLNPDTINDAIKVVPNLSTYGNLKIPYSTSSLWQEINLNDNVESRVWNYFGALVPGMIDIDGRKILVSDKKTKLALTNYIIALGKKALTSVFKDTIKYTWDIDQDSTELVFFNAESAIKQAVYKYSVNETNSIELSLQPFLIIRNHYFLVQMCIDESHCEYVRRTWKEKHINPGFTNNYPIDLKLDPSLMYIVPEFASLNEDIAYTIKDGQYFLIMKIL